MTITGSLRSTPSIDGEGAENPCEPREESLTGEDSRRPRGEEGPSRSCKGAINR